MTAFHDTLVYDWQLFPVVCVCVCVCVCVFDQTLVEYLYHDKDLLLYNYTAVWQPLYNITDWSCKAEGR